MCASSLLSVIVAYVYVVVGVATVSLVVVQCEQVKSCHGRKEVFLERAHL